MTHDPDPDPAVEPAEVVGSYGPFADAPRVHGVTYDGSHVWFASDGALNALDPATGEVTRSLEVAADAGTTYDGRHLFQLAGERIHKIDPATGRVLASIPAPAPSGNSGLAWADNALWVGQYHGRRIYQIDPETGAVLRTIESDRFVTGVTWVDGELWHATGEAGESELRRVDPASGRVLTRLAMPDGAFVSGVESDGRDLLFCGGGASGVIRRVRKPRRTR